MSQSRGREGDEGREGWDVGCLRGGGGREEEAEEGHGARWAARKRARKAGDEVVAFGHRPSRTATCMALLRVLVPLSTTSLSVAFAIDGMQVSRCI
uniref:Uncharacterized protein n=1 Tax=Oryza nivara TaxID=4536 RepID=A0A0E0I1G7_ORYNI